MTKFDESILCSFRDTVNGGLNGFVHFHYRNKNDRNQWNIICSCMDWIRVAIDHLNSKRPSHTDFDFFSEIAAIDVLQQSVNQLIKIIREQNSNHPLLKGQTGIFADPFGDDDDYFKHLRAIFGAHPVNLKNRGGSDQDEKWYASWPNPKGERSVYLSSNKNKENGEPKPHQKVIAPEDKIIKYAERYYAEIPTLENDLKVVYETYIQQMKETSIELSTDIYQSILELQYHSKQRMNLYKDDLESLLILLDYTPENGNSKLKNDYLNSLRPLIFEIKNNLQNMHSEELKESCRLIYKDKEYGPTYHLTNSGYAKNSALFTQSIDELNSFQKTIKFEYTDTTETLRAKIMILSYRYSKGKAK